jgi:hypothetical protein
MRALVAVALLAGCTATEVDVTLHIDAAIDLAKVGAAHLHVSGSESYDHGLDLQRGVAVQRFIYRASGSSGTLDFEVALYDGSAHVIGCGDATVALSSEHAATLDLPIAPGDCASNGSDLAVPGDLGVSDIGAPDLAGADLAHSAPDGAILYASFDDTLSGWNPLTPNGMAEIDSNYHHTGAGSLHLRLPPFGVDGGGYSQAFVIHSGVAIPDPVWVSAWVSYGANAAAYGSVGLIGMRDSSNNILGVSEDALVVRAIANGETGFTDWSSGGVFATQPSWTCLVFRAQSGTSGSVTLTLDGTDYNHPEPYTLAMPLTQLWLGIDSTPIGDQPLEVWLDEVTVANHPIGCN